MLGLAVGLPGPHHGSAFWPSGWLIPGMSAMGMLICPPGSWHAACAAAAAGISGRPITARRASNSRMGWEYSPDPSIAQFSFRIGHTRRGLAWEPSLPPSAPDQRNANFSPQ